MAVDVKKMDLPHLIALRNEVDAEISVKQQEARTSFVGEMKALAAAKGLVLSDMVDVKKVRGAKGVRAKAEAKYHDPAAPLNTWSGRGRLPKWLQEKVDAGRDKEDFRIASAGDGDGDKKAKRRGKAKAE
jgi:DNA-binding protein H-NS